MNDTDAPDRNELLSGRHLAAVACVVMLVSLILAGYGAAGSYDNLSHLAAARRVPLPRLVPVGLDGGLIGIIVLDIMLTWAGYPLWGLRATGRLFAAATIAANAIAGWPDPVGVFLRVFAPVLIVVITESVRAMLLKRRSEAGGSEGVPLARWLLDFRGTARLWRRMKLWRIRDYAEAVDMELSRLQAIEKLAALYGPASWRQAAPKHLAWMLRKGVRMPEALEMVAELTAPAKPEPALRNRPGTTGRNQGRKRAAGAARNRQPVLAGSPAPEAGPDEGLSIEAEARILELIGEGYTPSEARVLELIEEGNSASRAGLLAGKSDSYGRQVARLVKAAKKEPAGGERADGDIS